MSETSIRAEIVKIVPSLLWFGAAIWALYHFYGPITTLADRASSRDVTKISIAQIQIEFAQAQILLANGAGAIKTPDEFKPFEAHIKSLGEKLAGAKILWVDDNHPTQNYFERHAFGAIGISIDMARTNDEAFDLLALGSYDVIISDADKSPALVNGKLMPNGNEKDNDATCFDLPLPNGANVLQPKGSGCALLHKLHEKLADQMPPTIIYAGRYPESWGTPPYAFGRTNRVDRLLEFVLDALERRKVKPDDPQPVAHPT